MTLSTFLTSYGQTKQEKISSLLNEIKESINNLPKPPDNYFDSKYDFVFDDSEYLITVTDIHFEKGTKKKRKDFNIYTFKLSDLDPNAILLVEDSSNNTVEIRFFTMNNIAAITQRVSVSGKIRSTSYQDRMTLGKWDTPSVLIEIEKIKKLFSKVILSYYNGKLPEAISTDTGPLKFFSVQNASEEIKVIEIKQPKDESEAIYTIVEKMPLFDGSNNQKESTDLVNAYLKQKVKDEEFNVKGIVYISFIVNQKGETENVEVLRGINPNCDNKTIKYIEDMPKWTPGEQRGKKVKVKYTLPIKIKLLTRCIVHCGLSRVVSSFYSI
ncbi:MAG: energy transducer TonB [Saprospiraceae bacterium]|nr:energy transducer TonB [Saprospiraceae bacterium]